MNAAATFGFGSSIIELRFFDLVVNTTNNDQSKSLEILSAASFPQAAEPGITPQVH